MAPHCSSNKLQRCYRRLEYLGDLKVQQTRETNCCSSSWFWVQGTYFHLVCEPPSGPDRDPCLDLKQTWKTQVPIIFMIKTDEGKHVAIIKYIIIMKENKRVKVSRRWRVSYIKAISINVQQYSKACWFPAKCNKTMHPKCGVLISDWVVVGQHWSLDKSPDHFTIVYIHISGGFVKPLCEYSQLDACLAITGGPFSV